MGFLEKITGGDKKKKKESNTNKSEGPDVPLFEFSESGSEASDRGVSGIIEPISIIRMELLDLDDVDDIVQTVQTGDIMILDIDELLNNDPKTLKSAVERLKRRIWEFSGNIVRLTETLLLVVPRLVNIEAKKNRGKPERKDEREARLEEEGETEAEGESESEKADEGLKKDAGKALGEE